MAEKITPMQEQVAIDATVGKASFAQSFGNLALTPTIYGELGANMALSASVELSKKRGIEAGLNPSGSALPPITKADEAYNQAYNSQAYATLSNQAQNIFNQADEAVSKLNKISPDDISLYKANVQQSLEQVLESAPTDTKAQLFNNFNSQLNSNLNTYRNKYLTQQKQEQTSNLNVAISTAQQNIHESTVAGDFKSAKETLAHQELLIKQGQDTGVYSPEEADSLKTAAKINYQTGRLINQGLQAEENGKSAEWARYLVDPETRPDSINLSTWEAATTNALKYMQQKQSFSNQAAQVTASQGYLDIAEGKMTPSKMQEYQQQLKDNPVLFNNLAISYAHKLHQKQKTESDTDYYTANFQNWEVMKDASTENINKSYRNLSKLKQEVSKIPKRQADFMTAASSPVPVPAYLDGLAREIESGDPNLMNLAIDEFHELASMPGNKAAPFLGKAETMAKMINFEYARKTGRTSEEAAAIAQDIINRRKTDREYATKINQQTTSYLQDFADTPEKAYSQVRSWLGLSSNQYIENQGALVSSWMHQFSTAMEMTDGNVEKANSMVKLAFEMTHGETTVNGRTSYMQYPIEKFVAGGRLAIPLVQMDLHRQIKEAVENNKKTFDANPNQPFYYEVAGFPTKEEFEKYIKTKKDASFRSELIKKDPKELKDLYEKFSSDKPLKITKIYRDSKIPKQEWQTYLRNNPYQSMSLRNGGLIGGYDVGLYDPKTNTSDSFYGIFQDNKLGVSYYPDFKWIQDNFFVINKIEPDDPLARAADYIDVNPQKKKEEKLSYWDMFARPWA